MAKDKFHDNVKAALNKDGWVVTAEQLRITLDVTFIEVDIMAEAVLVAERSDEKIAVEVKSFLGGSIMSDFHAAIGQFLDYRAALKETDPERMLFLALPLEAWQHKVLQSKFIQQRLKDELVKLIIFNPDTESIVLWKR